MNSLMQFYLDMDRNLIVYHTNVSAKQNEIINVTADMLSMEFKDVRKEQTLSTRPDSKQIARK